jgi:DNA-binding NarL/FixJ family response regulator
MRTRIVLADGDPAFLRLLEQVLGAGFDIVGTVSDVGLVVQCVQELAPDVVVLGLAVAGLDVTRRITETTSSVKVIILSMHNDPAYVEEAFRVGASGFLLKSAERAELVTAIGHVMVGGTYVGEGLLHPRSH